MVLQKLYEKGWDLLRSIKDYYRPKNPPALQEVRQEVLRRVELALSSAQDQKIFPFEGIAIRLRPPSKSAEQEFRVDLVQNASLESDIRTWLKERQVQIGDLEISVVILEYAPPSGKDRYPVPLCEMEFQEPGFSAKVEVPELHLEILKGKAEQAVYRISKDRLLVGSLPEVHDLEGRLVRKNNIVFPHEGDEINSTVGSMHARIWFDYQRREFRVMDESSRYGTRIVREKNTVEVPPENPRGIGLRTGDEVYFGQACLCFKVVKKPD